MYKKYYEDMDYINNMKSNKEYHVMHMQLGSVAQMAGYREVTKANPTFAIAKELVPLFNVDEMFIKTFNKFVTNVKQEKDIIGKCMTELFHYIFNAGENYASMAQERAFAMLTMAYLEGDLNKLFDAGMRQNFTKMLGLEKNQLKYMLETIAQATLQNTVHYSLLMGGATSNYEQYFLRTNLEKQVPLYLDKIFWKILILLSQDVCCFDEVIIDFLRKKLEKMEK